MTASRAIQLGTQNTQHNHYYGAPRADSTSRPNLRHFEPLARLAAVSRVSIVVSETAEEMNRLSTGDLNGIDELLLCKRLAPTIATHGDWQLRRVFSQSLACALNSASVDERLLGAISGDLFDFAQSSPNFSVMLSMAATASAGAGLSFGRNLRDMYDFGHPQALWQHSRRPLLAIRCGEFLPLIDAVLDRQDPWVRRNLIKSCILANVSNGGIIWGETSRLLAALDGEDVRYLRAMLLGIDPAWRRDLTDALSARTKKQLHIEQDDTAGSQLSSSSFVGDPDAVRFSLERLSLQIDMENGDTQRKSDKPRPASDGKGRYGAIEDAVAYVFDTAGRESREGLSLTLLATFDEGIRWAVAARFNDGLQGGGITDSEILQVLKLLEDPHPWVTREALTMLSQTHLTLSATNRRLLADSAVAAVTRTEAQGWPRGEHFSSLAALVAAAPTLADQVDIVARKN